jgi:hypothetical protein
MTLATDTGNGYGARGCVSSRCRGILEGAACEAHTCAACGVVVDALAVFSLPWRDDAGRVWLDNTATACLACYAAIMNTLTPDRMLLVDYLETLSPDNMLRVDYYPRHKRRG